MLKKLELTEEFRIWLDGQTGEYDWDDGRRCAFATFLKAKHGPDADIIVGPFHYTIDDVTVVIPSPLQSQLKHAGSYRHLRELIDEGRPY